MTLKLALPLDLDARLRAEAARYGLSADALVASLLDRHLPASRRRAVRPTGEPTGEAVAGLLTLAGWYVGAMRTHAAELRGLTTGLLTGQKSGLSYAEMRRCERLDQAVFILGRETEELMCELRDEFALPPASVEEFERLRAEYNRVTEEHQLQMAVVQRVWADGEPPH